MPLQKFQINQSFKNTFLNNLCVNFFYAEFYIEGIFHQISSPQFYCRRTQCAEYGGKMPLYKSGWEKGKLFFQNLFFAPKRLIISDSCQKMFSKSLILAYEANMALPKKSFFFSFQSTVKGRYFRTKRFLPWNLVRERRWMAAIHKYHRGSENAILLASIR